MKSLQDCLLYCFVDTAYLAGRSAESVVQALCNGGADIIQVRAKNTAAAEVRRIATSVQKLTRAAGIPLVINDDWLLAGEIGAEGAHLGQEDFFGRGLKHRRDLRGMDGGFFLGLSTHAPAQAEEAVGAGADYIGVGPVFATGTKPGVQPVTVSYVQWAAKHIRIPWFAIGGITTGTVNQVLEAGARRICVVSDILTAPDISGACRYFKQRLLSKSRG